MNSWFHCESFYHFPVSFYLYRIYFVVLIFFVLFLTDPVRCETEKHCKACKDFVDTFRKGYDRTTNLNFGGGNTDWEETRLGSYATSETRLVEILEHVCTEGESKDKDMCHQFVEQNEEHIEKWYFHLQGNEPDFEKWLCIKAAKVCCPRNTYGLNCDPCPGMVDNSPCTGRGECEGSENRKGSGKCRCQKGYRGTLCDTCAFGFAEVLKNDTYIECKDINECEVDPFICKDNEYCYNTEGSYKCTKCNAACLGCTGAGAAKCKACALGYTLLEGSCTVVPQGLLARFLQLFENLNKTWVFCGGGAITSVFFIKNGEYSKLAIVGVLMAVILSAWHYGDKMLSANS